VSESNLYIEGTVTAKVAAGAFVASDTSLGA